MHRRRPAVADHDQRRPLGRRRREITIARRVVERVRRLAIRGRKLERLCDRDIPGIDRQRRPDANGLHRSGRQGDPYHRVRGPPRTADEHRMRGGGHQVVAGFQIDVDRDQRAGRRRRGSRSAMSRLRGTPRSIRDSSANAHVEVPKTHCGRPNSAAIGWTASTCPARTTMEIPPAGAIRHEVQRAVGRPPGLEDRLAAAAGRQCRGPEPAVRADIRGPQLGVVPGHVGMAPRQPRQTRAVRTETVGSNRNRDPRQSPSRLPANRRAPG